MLDISVIVPIYNAEKYMVECIESLLTQTDTLNEFIFINDGSTDGSLNIIQGYQKKDSRIIIINQNNEGVSAARNNGLNIAKGEYLCFVDADDFIDKQMLGKLHKVSKTKDLDILVSNFKIIKQNLTVLNEFKIPQNVVYVKRDINDQIIPIFLRDDSLNACWNKLYKSNLVKQNNIKFPVKMSHGEDAFFNLDCFSKAKSIMFISDNGYNYREVDGSATRNIINKDYFQLALNTYNYDHKRNFNLKLDSDTIKQLKSIRFVNSIIAIIHIYFKKKLTIGVINRIKYVNYIIKNEKVKQIFKDNWNLLIIDKSIYKKSILYLIKIRFVIGLFVIVSYSNLKNKNK